MSMYAEPVEVHEECSGLRGFFGAELWEGGDAQLGCGIRDQFQGLEGKTAALRTFGYGGRHSIFGAPCIETPSFEPQLDGRRTCSEGLCPSLALQYFNLLCRAFIHEQGVVPGSLRVDLPVCSQTSIAEFYPALAWIEGEDERPTH